MDVDDFNQLTEFVFDPSTPESDEETRIEETRDAPPQRDSAPRERIIRRRARKACVACHKRKVRCDVLARGHTCTNCRLDGINCLIRTGGKWVRGEPPGPASTSTETREIQSVPSADTPTIISRFAVESIEKNSVGVTTAGACPTPSTRRFPTFGNSAELNSQADVMFAYFDFLEAETFSHIAPEDFNFLEYKGCFHLPSRPILDDLVREYFLHVHPVLPVIDEHAFWEMYFLGGRRSKSRRIPLLVFRAMLFVSCSFASEDTIRRLGFQSTVEARSCMYRRAKLLYDFDTTSDPIALSQAALILTYYSSDREPLANTSWLRLAIQYANSVNVPMYQKDAAITSEERLIRKRLWWCLILRDRILPLGVRRPIQITHDSFDFSQPRLSEKDLEPEFASSRVYDSETKRDLARVFVAQLDLAVELTDAISHVYPANGFRSFDQLDYNTMLLMPGKIERCKDSLDSWHSKFQESIALGAWPNKHKSVSLYTGLSSIYYQSARAALCHCESFMLQADDPMMHELKMKELGSALHTSVASISETVREFVQLDVAKYLPVSAVAYMVLPIILHSLDLQNMPPTSQEGKRRQLRLLNEAMDLCKDRYTGARGANNVIKKTIEAARSEQAAPANQIPRSTSLVGASPERILDWFEMFISKPQQYLRISFTIDMSLSMGRYAGRDDLPQRISLHNHLISNSSTPPSIMLVNEELPRTTESFLEPAMLESARNSHLDYFDFNEQQSGGRNGESLWNGQTVDKILDEVIRKHGRIGAEGMLLDF